MFEDRTYENILQECFNAAPEGIDLRQGSIFYDTVAAGALKIAQFYADISTAFDLVFLSTAVDEYLDQKGAEFGVTRLPATPATYEYRWAGEIEPLPGNRFFANEFFFVLKKEETEGTLYLEAESPGSGGNNIISGTAAIPLNTIGGLTSSYFGPRIVPGADTESDNDYRVRIQEKIAGTAENGNRQHYKTWCESVADVGRARIVPLFAGENTVMGVIIGTDGQPAAEPIVKNVQNYIDPITRGGTVEVDGKIIPIGDGLGDGVANIGAHFAAVAPEGFNIDIDFAVELGRGATVEQIKTDAIAAIITHLKDIALNTPDNQDVIVRMSAISAILYAIPGLLDYTALTLNGGTANIEMTNMQIAVLGEVTVSEIV